MDIHEMKIAQGSKVRDVSDYVWYHLYLSADVHYGEKSETFLIESGRILDSMNEDEIAPNELVDRLISIFGDTYGWL